MELTDAQWEVHETTGCSPRPPVRDGVGHAADTRSVLEGVFWILRTGAQWAELRRDQVSAVPDCCHRRFQQWVGEGVLVKVLRALAEDLLARGQLDLAETRCIDATFDGGE